MWQKVLNRYDPAFVDRYNLITFLDGFYKHYYVSSSSSNVKLMHHSTYSDFQAMMQDLMATLDEQYSEMLKDEKTARGIELN